MLSGVAAGAAVLSASLRKALAATLKEPPGGSLRDIEHIVILMQENRSFDHYFGTMPGSGASPTRPRSGCRTGARCTGSRTRATPRATGLGFRVPAIVVSPRSAGGRVCSDMLDRTSLIRVIEKRFGVPEPNISGFRRRTCGDFTSALRFSAPPAGFPRSLRAITLAAAEAGLLTAQQEVFGNPLRWSRRPTSRSRASKYGPERAVARAPATLSATWGEAARLAAAVPPAGPRDSPGPSRTARPPSPRGPA